MVTGLSTTRRDLESGSRVSWLQTWHGLRVKPQAAMLALSN